MPATAYFSQPTNLQTKELEYHWLDHPAPPPDDGMVFVPSVLNGGISVELFENLREKPLLSTDKADQILRCRKSPDEHRYWLNVLPQTSATVKNVDSFWRCGKNAWIEHSKSRGQYRVRSQTCGQRICPVCGKRRREEVRKRLLDAFALLPRSYLRFLTLTLRSTKTPLADQLARLTKCFRQLRQRKFWREKVTFGAAVVELTRARDTGNWHPHLHIIMVGEFIDQNFLSRTWKEITGDSMIVDIRKIDSTQVAIEELAKYASKPTAFEYLKGDARAGIELYESIKNRHLLIVFGDAPDHLRRINKKKRRDKGPDDWKSIAPLWVVVDLALAGNENAKLLIRSLDDPILENLKLPGRIP